MVSYVILDIDQSLPSPFPPFPCFSMSCTVLSNITPYKKYIFFPFRNKVQFNKNTFHFTENKYQLETIDLILLPKKR